MIGGRGIRAAVLAAAGLIVAACAAPVPSTPPVAASAASGVFRLDLTIDRTTWRAGELVTGSATLENTGRALMEAYGADLLTFEFKEASGTREFGNVIPASCGPHELAPGDPLAVKLSANGAASSDAGDAWIRSANDAVGVRLPAGTWDVIALAAFTEGDCFGASLNIAATARVTVLP
jgi:hypothetical protein